MKSFLTVYILFVVLTFSIHKVNAKSNTNKNLHFKGTFADSKNRAITQMAFSYNVDDGFAKTGHRAFMTTIDKQGNFEFDIPDLGKPFKISLTPFLPDVRLWVGEFYVQSGDDIALNIRIGDKDTVEFSGAGASKYDLVEKMGLQYWEEYIPEILKLRLNELNIAKEPILKLDSLSGLIEKFRNKKSDLLKEYIGKIDPEILELINYEFANYYSDWRFRMELLYNDNEKYSSLISNNYRRFNDLYFLEPNSMSNLCPKYISGLASKIKLDLRIKNHPKTVNIVEYYELLKNSYSLKVRDRLIGWFTFSRFATLDLAEYDPQIMDSITADAFAVVETKYVKNAISEKLKLTKGTKLFSSSFVDIDGNSFNFSALKGKTILLDVWFLGCGGCAAFHEKFEREIYPLFSENKNLIIVTINVDRTKDNWIKGLKSNLYASDHSINVWTGNVHINHPFMKYYNIQGAPYLMLIDKNGNVYSQVEQVQALDIKIMTELLKGALDVKVVK